MAHIFNHKFLLNCCNLLLLLCGGTLICAGFYLFSDTKRILLSRLLAATSEQLNDLPQPLFYYIAIGLTVAGLVATLAAIVGCWAACLSTYCCLSVYFLTVVVLLLAESVACLAITLWPHCLGISLDTGRMVKALQGNYGVPGKEQFTVAMDLAQARFGCCGMSSPGNYDASMWKLQRYGQRDWSVPLTCCMLSNSVDALAHLDPQAVNETNCESIASEEHTHYRYTEACLAYLDAWYREQYVIFLAASLVLTLVEFCVLLCIVLSCTHLTTARNKAVTSQHSMRRHANGSGTRNANGSGAIVDELRAKSRQGLVENIYDGTGGGGVGVANGGNITAAPMRQRGMNALDFDEDFKEVYIQPRDLYKQRHNTTFKPNCRSDYNLPTSRSYLV